MDTNRRLKSLIAFHFGRPTAQDPDSEAAIRRATDLAYLDLRRTLWGMGTHQDALMLKKQTRESVSQFVHSLGDVKSQAEFDEVHQEWCDETISFFEEHPHDLKEDFEFHYGQAQKWLNMTLKYLATLGNTTVLEVYLYLHAPIDDDVFTRAALVLKIPIPQRRGMKWSWSRLNYEAYWAYQLALRQAVAESSGGKGNVLDWETDEWIKAR